MSFFGELVDLDIFFEKKKPIKNWKYHIVTEIFNRNNHKLPQTWPQITFEAIAEASYMVDLIRVAIT